MADFKDVIMRLQENKNDNREVIETQTKELVTTVESTTKSQNRSFGQSLALQFKKNNDSLATIKETFTNNFSEMISSAEDQANAAADRQQGIADEAERQSLLDTKKGGGDDGSKEADGVGKETKKGLAGILGKLGMGAGAAMLGGGALLAGAGILAGGAGFLLKELNDLDGKAVRANVKELMGISDDMGGKVEFFLEGGSFMLAMTGLGLGLAAFSIGAGVATAVDHFSGESEFAKNIRANVKELLAINDDHGSSMDFLSDGGTFFVAMTAIGAGLAVFGAGSAVAAASDTFLALDAESIVNNVSTLLGINDLFSGFGDALVEGGTFFVAMTAIAAGLAVFGAGSAVAALTTAGGDFVNPDWAQGIVDNVTTLLSIASLENLGDTALFVATMTGIGAGLLAFSVGKGAASTAEIITQFSGVDFAQTIKDNVTDLLGIMDDPNINVSKAADFTTVMGVISAGLLAFSGGKLVSALANVGTSILNFLSGEKSPVQEMLDLADSADDLTTASTALDSLAVSLMSISGLQFDGKKINMKEFASDLAESVPVIEAAIMGGTIKKFGLFNDIDFQGLASPEVDFETAAQNISMLREALGYEMAQQQDRSAEASANNNAPVVLQSDNRQNLVSNTSSSTFSIQKSTTAPDLTMGELSYDF